jgi:hypothetical protein
MYVIHIYTIQSVLPVDVRFTYMYTTSVCVHDSYMYIHKFVYVLRVFTCFACRESKVTLFHSYAYIHACSWPTRTRRQLTSPNMYFLRDSVSLSLRPTAFAISRCVSHMSERSAYAINMSVLCCCVRVSVCMFACMHVCTCVSMYVCVQRTACIRHESVCFVWFERSIFMQFMYVCMFVCNHVCMHVIMYVCMHVIMYVCMHVIMYVLHTSTQQHSQTE